MPPNNWEVDIQRDQGGKIDRVEYRRCGMMGNDKCDGAIKISCHKQYNGSGSTAFDSSSEWPCISVTIPFQEGHEDERNHIANLLRRLIDKEISR